MSDDLNRKIPLIMTIVVIAYISGGLNQTENRSQYFGFLQLPEVTAFHGADSRVVIKSGRASLV